ncbi:MAG TPA: hypothetical protein PLV06_12535 [Bacteroidales bacterium]|nr:hypothetical protein [Bacteroidales bacterium]HPF01596.1 hypothetical protein [Bacteroidales bacterium]HPJ59327.1 hypothetical protein [Bacteroidales bacterium]HPR13207.1 hypothetical protein [Bacteroidales bacterium]HRW83948.1 hypothetical protein [Bacteroidales bacterium]
MAHADKVFKRHREHHPQVGFGLFLVLLGVSLLVATNDLLGLGEVRDYFTWESAMIFVGLLLILNLNFIGGTLLVAGGLWFWFDEIYGQMPELLKTVYWPGIIMLTGLIFIISSFVKKGKQSDNKQTN